MSNDEKKTVIDSSDAPLFGRRVLVTRASRQSAELTSLLEASGALVIHCPTIEVIAPDDYSPLDSAISQIEGYDWILFTSGNAVRFFLGRLQETMGVSGAARVQSLHIGVVGASTAGALQRFGIRAELEASESHAEGLLRALLAHLGGDDAVRDLRFLVPRSRIAGDTLPDGLRKRGAVVDSVEAYQTIAPATDMQPIRKMLVDELIDAIVFTSSSTVSNFAALLGVNNLSNLFKKTVVACIGPVTATTAREFGVQDVIQPEVFNATELAKIVISTLSEG